MPLIQVIVPQVMNLKPQLRDTSKVFERTFVGKFSAYHLLAVYHRYQLIDYLVSFFSYIFFKDEEDVKAIARLFADMGDSYVELIATGMILVY